MAWREYTRETPARPGLAIVTSALFLVAAVWLASLVATAKAEPIVLGARYRSLDWPVSIRLPQGSTRVDTATAWPEDVQRDGSIGATAFEIADPQHGEARIEILFQIMPAGTSPEQAGRKLLGGGFRGGEAISMGPMQGLLLRSSPFSPVGRWIAVGCAPNGLAVLLQLISTESTDRQGRVFHAVCESVRFDDWAVRP